MKKEKSAVGKVVVSAFVLVILALVFAGVMPVVAATTWTVDDSGGADFTTIQWAVDNASAGDTIIVRDGTYTENVDVNKSLTIRSENGADRTIIQAANSDDHVIEVTADYVNISGFTVKKGTYNAGIYLRSDNCNICNNTASNNIYGIYLFGSDNNKITNNNVSNNFEGIYLWVLSNNNKITNNNVNSNDYTGIYLYYSGSNVITNNTISNNFETGVALIHYSNGNRICLNNFINNPWNVYSWGSTNYWNSFKKITYIYNGSTYTNYLGNYWDDYVFAGNDTNKDGIGDTLYSIDGYNDNYPLMERFENYFAPPENKPPTCAIELQKNGIPIDNINVGEFFDIFVGDSTDDQGIKEVRFSSDESQDGNPTGEWTDWFDWSTSSGDWNAETKTKAWSFATGGAKEVWAEVKDDAGQTAKCSANIYANLPSIAKPVITSPLEFTPRFVVYGIGEVITAQFTITNKGTAPIVFKVLTVGGRDPDGKVVDFDWQESITLNPSASHDYIGNLILPEKNGTYHFFCTYQTEDGNWNTCVDLGPGLTDDDRAKRITVAETVIAPPREFVFEAVHLSSEDYKDLSKIAKEILTQEKSKLDANDPKVPLINQAIVLAHRMETEQRPPRDPIREGELTGFSNFWSTFWGEIIGLWTGVPGVKDACKQWGFDIAEALYLKDMGFVRMKQSGIGDITITDRRDKEGAIVSYQGCPLGGIFISTPVKSKWVFSPISLIRKQLYLPDLESYSINYTEKCDITAQIKSPAELRVYDSQYRVTGLVEGEVKEEIPNSMYDKENNTVTILFASSTYRYEVVGTDEGLYGLGVTSVEDGEATTFTATDIPTMTGATHQYTIDWDALSQGEEGVTVQVDSDGDGTFEDTFTADNELSRDEFISATKGIYIESSDITGSIKNIFAPGESVYAIGSVYVASTTYNLYVVNDTTWTDGMIIPTRVTGTETTVATDESGNIPAGALIWASAVIGKYDIIVDANENGVYDEDIDPIDDMDVNTAGFETVPEFTTIAIPVATVLGLVFLMFRRKRK